MVVGTPFYFEQHQLSLLTSIGMESCLLTLPCYRSEAVDMVDVFYLVLVALLLSKQSLDK
jgi:hypothetical protein